MANLAAYFICLIGTVVLLVQIFTDAKHAATWARNLTFVVVGLIISTVILGLVVEDYRFWIPGPKVCHYLGRILPLARGVIIGLLVALVSSGQLNPKRRSVNNKL